MKRKPSKFQPPFPLFCWPQASGSFYWGPHEAIAAATCLFDRTSEAHLNKFLATAAPQILGCAVCKVVVPLSGYVSGDHGLSRARGRLVVLNASTMAICLETHIH